MVAGSVEEDEFVEVKEDPAGVGQTELPAEGDQRFLLGVGRGPAQCKAIGAFDPGRQRAGLVLEPRGEMSRQRRCLYQEPLKIRRDKNAPRERHDR